jgi:hypothetical protein
MTKLSERLKMKRSRHSDKNVTHTMDQILWDYSQIYGEKLPPGRKLSEEEIAICGLRAFEEYGHAVREADVDGNLTWRATAKMLEHSSLGAGGIVTIRAPAPVAKKPVR